MCWGDGCGLGKGWLWRWPEKLLQTPEIDCYLNIVMNNSYYSDDLTTD